MRYNNNVIIFYSTQLYLSILLITTLHVSALHVGHHQVCLEFKSYKVHAGKGVGGWVARYRYVGSYLWIVLGNYGIVILLLLWFHEVCHATLV